METVGYADAQTPEPSAKQATVDDLNELLLRMQDACEHMGAANKHRRLLLEAGAWLVQLGNECIQLGNKCIQKDAALQKATGERRLWMPGDPT